MRLHPLTPDELAFLTAPAAGPDDFAAQLTRKLAATLSARLHLSVSLVLQTVAATADAPAPAPETPIWQPDAALATLWLTRRLGGQRVTGATPFVPRSLLHTLDAALAEGWLDGAGQAVLPA
ncbi:MAG TPA: hypothetical protein VKO83_08125, partial [Steroidobacteraceae bacterium]|nr:hypothetical protein [Steroidobacteraceae bacterium]